MEFFFIFTLWWLELHTITAMVDFQSISEGWLDDATLFPAEHNDYLNFDDFLNPPKTYDDGLHTDQWSGLQWLEENVKLNINDDPNSFTLLPNETEALINECFKSYPDLLQFNPEALILPSDDMKTEINNLPETNSSIPSSPVSKDIPLSPPYSPISEASSPASYISDIPVDSTLYGLCLSPASTSDSSRADTPPVVSVTICKNEEVGSEPAVPMTIEEVASSVMERKYLNAGRGEVPKVQVSLKNTFHPYSRTKSGSRRKRTSDPAERKKVQNKEAAARYRMKKRSEEMVLSDEVSNLEKEQKELQGKHDDILSEIKYLKSLMCEMLQKKGLM